MDALGFAVYDSLKSKAWPVICDTMLYDVDSLEPSGKPAEATAATAAYLNSFLDALHAELAKVCAFGWFTGDSACVANKKTFCVTLSRPWMTLKR